MKNLLTPFYVAAALLILPAAASAQTTFSLGLRLGANLATRSGDEATQGTSMGLTAKQDFTRSAILAGQVGVVANIGLGNWAFQPGILLSQKGSDQQLTATTSNPGVGGFYSPTSTRQVSHAISRPNYVEIPLNVVYTTGGDHGFQLFAGPYVAWGVGGQSRYESESLTTNTNTTSPTSLYYTYGQTFFTYTDKVPGPQMVTFGTGTNSFTQSPTPFEVSSGSLLGRRFDAGVNVGVGYRVGPVQAQLSYGLGLMNQQPEQSSRYIDPIPAYYQRVAQLTATYFVPFAP